MAQRDPNTLTPREKHLIKKHRQSVAKFERIYGPTSVLLGRSIPECLKPKVVVNPDSANSSLGPSTTTTSKPGANKAATAKPAKGMLKTGAQNPGCSNNCSQRDAIKRARSGDEHSSTNKAKKVKKSNSVDQGLQVAVIDRNDPDGRISTEKWQLIENGLLEHIYLFDGRSDSISFKGADWSKGVKIVNCGNKISLEFLRTTIGKFESLCPGMKLEVICSSELPLRPVLSVWFPPPVQTVERILTILSKQNDGLTTSHWKLITSLACKENKGRDFRFAMDRESLRKLELVGGVLNFGLGTVRFRLPKSDKTKEAAGGADKSASL